MGWAQIFYSFPIEDVNYFVQFRQVSGWSYYYWRSKAPSGVKVFTSEYSLPSSWGSTVKIDSLYSYRYPDYYVQEQIDFRNPVQINVSDRPGFRYTPQLLPGGNLKCRLVDSVTGEPITTQGEVSVPYYEYDETGNFSPTKTMVAPLYEGSDGWCDSVLGNTAEADQYKACCAPGEHPCWISGDYFLNIDTVVTIPESGYLDLGTIAVTTYGNAYIQFIDSYSGWGWGESAVDAVFDKLDLFGDSLDTQEWWSIDLEFLPAGELTGTFTIVDPTTVQSSSVIQQSFNIETQRNSEFQILVTANVQASGKVVDLGGNPISGVKMEFGISWDSGPGAHIPAPVYTDVNGEWSVDGLNYGVNYLIHPSLAGCIFSEPEEPSDDVYYYEAPFPTQQDTDNMVFCCEIYESTTEVNFRAFKLSVPEVMTPEIRSANPTILLQFDRVKGGLGGPNVHFQVEAFKDSEMTNLITGVNSQEHEFSYDSGNGVWHDLYSTGLPSELYSGDEGSITLCTTIFVGPLRKAYLRASAGFEES